MRMARLAISTEDGTAERRRSFGLNVFASAYEEMIAHRGIPFDRLAGAADARRHDIVLLASDPDDDSAERFLDYARAGGIVVSCGGLRSCSRAMGYAPVAPSGPAYAVIDPPDGELAFMTDLSGGGRAMGLRFLYAEPWVARNPDRTIGDRTPGLRHQSEGIQLLHEIDVGEGIVARFALDISATVVALQQGPAPVLTDGAPAPDGTADLDDGVLKADDSMALDWEHDRYRSSTGHPFFAHPYADWWRELLVGYLIRLAYRRGLSLPFTEYWPSGPQRVLMVSHDSDGNADEHARSTLGLLRESRLASTWCILEPGYSIEVCLHAHEAGNELAFHYNAVAADGGSWGSAEFTRQLEALRSKLHGVDIVSNKNHLTRFEGWGELFEWCEATGIEADQTRGPSKRGNLGFVFATCHPYRPSAWFDDGNRLYDVLEMGFLSPDMNTGMWGDESLVEPLFDAVIRVQGMVHLLFHPVHIHERASVRHAFATALRVAGDHGFARMTGAQINAWERLRRRAVVEAVRQDGTPVVAAMRGSGLVVVSPLPQVATTSEDFEVYYRLPCRETAF